MYIYIVFYCTFLIVLYAIVLILELVHVIVAEIELHQTPFQPLDIYAWIPL